MRIKKEEKTNRLVTKKYFDLTIREFNKKFIKIDKRFDDIDKKFDKIDKKFDEIDKRFDFIIDHFNSRFEAIEQMVADLSTKIARFTNSVLNSLDKLTTEYKKLDEETTVLAGRYPQINDKLDDHEVRISALEKKLDYKAS